MAAITIGRPWGTTLHVEACCMCYGSALNSTTRSKAFGFAILYCTITVQKMLQPLFVFRPNVAKTSPAYKSRLANCCRNVLYVPEHFRSEKQLIPSRTVLTETETSHRHTRRKDFFIRAICPSNSPFLPRRQRKQRASPAATAA